MKIRHILGPAAIFLLLVQTGWAQQAPNKGKFLGNIIDNTILFPDRFSKEIDPTFATYWDQITPSQQKWGAVQPTQGVFNWAGIDGIYNYAHSHGFAFKYHALLWSYIDSGGDPTWVIGLPPADQVAAVHTWMQAFFQRYPNTEYVDVVNEPLHRPSYAASALGGSGVTGWDWVIKAYEIARMYAPPNTKLLINDYGVEHEDGAGDTAAADRYLHLVQLLKDRGLLDGIGLQCHFLEYDSWTVATVKPRIDKLAAVGLPIYVSEMTIDTSSDSKQLDKMQQFFTYFWNNPAIKGVTVWGYLYGHVDPGYDYLIRQDGTERPALTWLRNYMTDVTVATTGRDAYEEGSSPGGFRITRPYTTGPLTVDYSLSGSAGAADYAETLNGSVTIPDGQSYVDVPVTPVNDLTYYEGTEILKLSISLSPNYRAYASNDYLYIHDNDLTYRNLQAGFNGFGTGTGGSGNFMDFGGTATSTQSGASTVISTQNSPDMGGGNFFNVSATTSGGVGGITITPVEAGSSWAAMTTKPGSQWLINGAFDFFWRGNTGTLSATEFDFSNAGSGGWRLVLNTNPTSMRFQMLPPTGGTSFGPIGNYSTLVAGQIYHFAVTFNTDPATGIMTVRYFRKTGNGPINTGVSTDRVFQGTFNPDETFVTNTFSAGGFFFGNKVTPSGTSSQDFDAFRLWNSDPGILPGIDGDESVRVVATVPNASEAGLAPGTFTISRNTTVGARTVYYTFAGSAANGTDYTATPAGSVTIPDGQSSATVKITPIADGTPERKERVRLKLVQDPHYSVDGSASSASVIIADNDGGPNDTVNVAVTAPNASEAGPTSGTFTVSRDSTEGPLTVYYTFGGTAVSGADYTASPGGSVTIPDEQSLATVDITPTADLLLEGDESVQLSLTPMAQYSLGTAPSGIVTIRDSAMDTWRVSQFGENASTPAIGGDAADPDQDGVTNLTEYALGLDPNAASANGLPQSKAETIGGVANLTLAYRKLRSDILYAVEISTNLKDWTIVPDQSAGFDSGVEIRKAAVPVDGLQKFLRLRSVRK